MSTTEPQAPEQNASIPQVTPRGNVGNSDDAPFIWQKLNEISEKLGAINTNLAHLNTKIDGVEARTLKAEEKLAKIEGTVDKQLDRVKTAWVVAAFILGVIAVVLVAAWPVVIKPGLKTTVTEEIKPLLEQHAKDAVQKAIPPAKGK